MTSILVVTHLQKTHAEPGPTYRWRAPGLRDSGRNRFLEAPGLTRQQAVWSEQGGYPGRREESTGEACGKHQVSTIVQGHESLGVLLFLFGVSFWLLETWSLKKTTLVQPQDDSAGKGSCC